MALQGTIDILPLTDVLQLLATSSRTGRLVLEGDRGRAMVAVHEGRVAGGDLDGTRLSPLDLVVAVLRFGEGSFVFDVDEIVLPEGAEPRPVPELLEEAAGVLAEWQEVLAVVPSPLHRVAPVPTVGGEVVLGPDDWTTVLASTGVPSLEALGAHLELGDLAAGRRVVDLVARGLLEVRDPLPATPEVDHLVPAPAGTAGGHDVPPHPPWVGAPAVPLPAEVLDPPAEAPFPEHFPIDDLVVEEGDEVDSWSEVAQGGEARSDGSTPFPEGTWAAGDWDDRQSAWDALVDDTEGLGGLSDGPSAFGPAAEEPVWDPAPSWAALDAPGDPGEVTLSAFVPSPEPEVRAAVAFRDVEAPVSPAFHGDPLGVSPEAGPVDGEPVDEGTDEVLRQMARLSPKAAEAIAAALGTVTDPSADGAVADDGFLRPG